MKKLIITFCLMLLCIALFNSRVYAVFVTKIDTFVQHDGSDTFTDIFDGVDEPITGSEYVVEGIFGPTRQSGGLLKLDSDDGILDIDVKFLAADVSDSTYFFSHNPTEVQYVEAWIDFSGGLPFDPFTFFDIEILNFASDEGGGIVGDPATDDSAWVGVDQGEVDGELHLFGAWGDDTQFDPLGFADLGSVDGNTTIGLRLEIDSTDKVTALFNYKGSGFITHTGSADFSTLSFISGDVYTGGFAVGAVIPEPTTMALLGIGLAGLGGRYWRRRKQRQKADNR